jgi:putative hydrolase of the HAD superfamily
MRCVIWDMGGIFQRYFTEPMVEIGRARGWPVDRLPLGPTGPAPDPAYERMAEGEVTEGEYLRGLLAALAAEGITFDPVSDHDWEQERRPEVWALIEQIAEDPAIRQITLTNDATAWMGELWWETWPDAHRFDALVDVATIGVRKPAPEPFLHALAVIGLPASDCVFVDDMPVNCRGAEAVGIRAVWFDITDPTGSVKRLREAIDLPETGQR